MTMTYPAFLSETDYSAIETALAETEKGRLFLRAYVERNRSSETQALLRNISRLHRATIGKAAAGADIRRDLRGLLQVATQLRTSMMLLHNGTPGSSLLSGTIEELEARLITLTEIIEDRSNDLTYDASDPSGHGMSPINPTGHSAKLFGELSHLFSAEPHLGPAEAS
jgi:hypothetical protein